MIQVMEAPCSAPAKAVSFRFASGVRLGDGGLSSLYKGKPPETFPFGVNDVTAGAENELLAVVKGAREHVDLPRIIEESNYFKNLERRAAAGDASKSLVRDIRDYLAENRENVWENSWVYFPMDRMTPYARDVFTGDLYMDKRERSTLRSDAGRFEVQRNGIRCIRIPVSYLLKLALADAISITPDVHPVIRTAGEPMMKHFLNDNTSPETFSFHTVAESGGAGLGRALASETQRRLLLVQLLTMYANEKFELRARGQEALVCMAPHTPVRQKQLNELVSDSFYRDLFMSPCLSGWEQGEAKYHYMILCHEVLSRSRLTTMGKLRECGILSRDLVTLPTVSNTSLANNGTHISLGSRQLTAMMAAGAPEFSVRDEALVGDLVVKIVEHFLPLFVGTYSAAPYRFDFQDFHPETVLGFLPHELDFTHLRMLWRRWKGKANLQCFGIPVTPFGPRRLDRCIGKLFRLRGDWVPDQRLLDYLVSPLSTNQSPALDGRLGNADRLKKDLAEMGVFDARMSFYSLYRQRLFAKMGFCGFEGRHYSQFGSIARDMADATDLQRLVTALAYQYVLTGAVTHSDIPDTPVVESERRQIFFGSAVGIPTFFIDSKTSNRFLGRILHHALRMRASHRYAGRTRIYNVEYRRALVKMLEQDGAGLVEAMGLGELVCDLKRRIEVSCKEAAQDVLVEGIMKEAGGRSPLDMPAAEFNAAAERYYRETLRKQFLSDAWELFGADVKSFLQHADASGRDALRSVLNGEDATSFLETVRANILDSRVSQSVLVKLIHVNLLVIRYNTERNHGAS